MKKRLLCTIVCLALAASLLPVGALASDQVTLMSGKAAEVNVTVTAPAAGEVPGDSCFDLGTGYEVVTIMWGPEDPVFLPGTEYTVSMYLEAKEGYYFDRSIPAYINGVQANVPELSRDSMRMNYTFPATADTAVGISVSYDATNINAGLNEPVTINASFEISGSPESGISLQWYRASANYIGTGTAIPGATGTSYTVATNTPGTSYYYCEVTAVINGQRVSSLDSDSPMVKVVVSSSPYVFPFTDVEEFRWYYASVRDAHKMGLINGMTETTFCPDDNMTYAGAIKLAACMHQLYHYGEVTLTNGSPWYKSYYDYCLENDIIEPDATAFEPGYPQLYEMANELVSREMYVYIFARCLPEEAFPAINEIPDDAIPDVPTEMGVWDDGIYLFYRAGIVNGMDSQGTFLPNSNIKRSEIATLLIRMMDPSARVGAPADLAI